MVNLTIILKNMCVLGRHDDRVTAFFAGPRHTMYLTCPTSQGTREYKLGAGSDIVLPFGPGPVALAVDDPFVPHCDRIFNRQVRMSSEERVRALNADVINARMPLPAGTLRGIEPSDGQLTDVEWSFQLGDHTFRSRVTDRVEHVSQVAPGSHVITVSGGTDAPRQIELIVDGDATVTFENRDDDCRPGDTGVLHEFRHLYRAAGIPEPYPIPTGSLPPNFKPMNTNPSPQKPGIDSCDPVCGTCQVNLS